VKNLTPLETIVIVVLILLFAGMIIRGFSKPVTTKDVYQYIDHDAQIVCYILENGNGISCLPLSEVSINE